MKKIQIILRLVIKMIISLIRAILLYIVIILAVRIMGKRQISELQTTELVVTLLISDIAAIPMQNTAQPLASGLIPIVVLVSCELIISVIMLKSAKFRRFVCGKPIVVINNGKIDQKQLRRLRMSTEDLSEQLRQMNIFRLTDVAYAIVETNGKMSVLKKSGQDLPTTSMMGITVPDTVLDAVVISDGEISDFSLSLCNLTKNWVYGVLQGQHLSLEDVFIMTANKNKDFYIVKKEDSK